jgi:type IV pilus assembly protein PilA
MNRRDEKGFTLIELMIVIAIIGILAAIAIPQFSAYRNRAHNAAALSDLKNAITAQEAYFVDTQHYVDAGGSIGPADLPSAHILSDRYGVRVTKNAAGTEGVTIALVAGSATGYEMTATNSLASPANTYRIATSGGNAGQIQTEP